MHRIFTTSVADVYPHYVAKVTKKGRTEDDLVQVITWLTGYTAKQLQTQLNKGVTFIEFFDKAKLHPNAELITGSICGVKIQEIKDPLMKKIRYLDKIVDELAKGKEISAITRQ